MEIEIIDMTSYVSRPMVPKDLIGRPHGELWESMPRSGGEAAYYITCGAFEAPLYLFKCDGEYQLVPADVEGLLPHVYVERRKAKLSLKVVIDG